MTEDSMWSTSRRTFVKYGALSTGALVGASGPTAAVDADSGDRDPPVDRGAMFPYQLTPGHRATVVESGLDWQPDRLEGERRTHVIAYDHVPSYRAFLFTDPDRSLEPERSVVVSDVRESPAAGSGLVTVGLE